VQLAVYRVIPNAGWFSANQGILAFSSYLRQYITIKKKLASFTKAHLFQPFFFQKICMDHWLFVTIEAI
jgi:hypothetical protein